MKNTIQKSVLSTNLIALVFVLCGAQLLHAQGDATLINITNLEQLDAMRYDLGGDGVADDVSDEAAYQVAFSGLAAGSYKGYELMVNLDFEVASSYASSTINMDWTTGSGWEPIGIETNGFTAIFEGNGYTISNLFIDRSSASYVGLFGYVGGSTAELRNLGMVDVEVAGDSYVGGLVGLNEEGTVSGSYATGSVTGTSRVGGLVGVNERTVSGSYTMGSVTGDDSVGGLVGVNQGDISDSYAMGSVTGNDSVGGLVGLYTAGTVSNSYAAGSVTGDDSVGGLVGFNTAGTVLNSYAAGSVTGKSNVGGLVGSHAGGTVTASYYNVEITGQSDTGKDESKTTAELLTPTGYTGIYQTWNDGLDGMANNEDDTDYWDFGTNGQYPVLKLDVDGNGIVGNAADFSTQRPLVFRRENYVFGVSNTAMVGTLVGSVRVQAVVDSNNDLTYSIVGSSAEFAISNADEVGNPFKVGQLSVKTAFSTGTYDLVVQVEDVTIGESHTVEVIITTDTLLDLDGDGLIEIRTLEQLNAIRYDLDGDGVADATSNETSYQVAFSGLPTVSYNGYELMANLDFEVASSYASGTINMDWITGSGWEPIGNAGADGIVSEDDEGFATIFEGNGHTISNLYINRFSTIDVGLFGYISGSTAELRNIGLLDVKVTGSKYVGGLVGTNDEGMVSGSYATGSVTGNRFEVGGLVGRNQGGTISDSYAMGSVTGSYDSVALGGLVGDNRGDIVSSYATGSVTGGRGIGGLVGDNFKGSLGYNLGNIVSSYATGSVAGSSVVGGLVGNNLSGTVSGSYATGSVTGNSDVGGLVGRIEGIGKITASYYNRQATGQSDTGKGEGKTTADLLTPTGYVGIYQTWNDEPDGVANNGDDTDYWDFGTNEQYPVLKLDVDGNGTVGDEADLHLQRLPKLSIVLFSLDFGEVSTASTPGTMTYNLSGANLTGDVTLELGDAPTDIFTISPTVQ